MKYSPGSAGDYCGFQWRVAVGQLTVVPDRPGDVASFLLRKSGQEQALPLQVKPNRKPFAAHIICSKRRVIVGHHQSPKPIAWVRFKVRPRNH